MVVNHLFALLFGPAGAFAGFPITGECGSLDKKNATYSSCGEPAADDRVVYILAGDVQELGRFGDG